jgi:hypothetical protein
MQKKKKEESLRKDKSLVQKQRNHRHPTRNMLKLFTWRVWAGCRQGFGKTNLTINQKEKQMLTQERNKDPPVRPQRA